MERTIILSLKRFSVRVCRGNKFEKFTTYYLEG